MSLTITRPLKAPSKPIDNLANLQFPLYASDKLDGIRCLIHPTLGPVSQKMLPIPNNHIRAYLRNYAPHGLDGELIIPGLSFNEIQSIVMSEVTVFPPFEYRVFDTFSNIYDDYCKRWSDLMNWWMDNIDEEHIKLLRQTLCHDLNELNKFESDAISRGCEGVMVRQPKGPYKEGRSTEREGFLLKIVRFQTDEAVVVGIAEQMENCNIATTDGNGLTKRSKHQDNLREKGQVGTLICKWQNKEIRIGTGMTDAQRIAWWYRPETIIGKTISFKYKPFGMKDLPRAPIFKGIRYDV